MPPAGRQHTDCSICSQAFSASALGFFSMPPGRKQMIRTYLTAAILAAVLAIPVTAFAQQGRLGTADEAKAMLMKAVAAVKADRDVALGMFNKGEGGFRDRDLYVFCSRAGDGKNLAGLISVPSGTDTRTPKDPTGKEFGKELYAAAQKPEGQVTEVSYMFPKPGTTAPAVPKVSFVTRVADLGCGVGYYK
jgi:hypothetical protein